MKKYLLLLCLFCFSVEGMAQKINRQYSFYPQETGSLYFIHPQTGFSSKDPGTVKGLIYDITYLSERDSATFAFTYYTQSVLKVDSVFILDAMGQEVYKTPANVLYVQPKSSYWQQRVNYPVPYEILTTLYEASSPYQLVLSGDRQIRYTLKPGVWKKQSAVVTKIFEVVKYNK